MIETQYIQEAIKETVRSLHRAGTVLRTEGMTVELPEMVEFTIKGIIAGSDPVITSIAASSEEPSISTSTKSGTSTTTKNDTGHTDTSTKIGNSTTVDNNESTTSGTSNNALSGGNSKSEDWVWEEV